MWGLRGHGRGAGPELGIPAPGPWGWGHPAGAVAPAVVQVRGVGRCLGSPSPGFFSRDWFSRLVAHRAGSRPCPVPGWNSGMAAGDGDRPQTPGGFRRTPGVATWARAQGQGGGTGDPPGDIPAPRHRAGDTPGTSRCPGTGQGTPQGHPRDIPVPRHRAGDTPGTSPGHPGSIPGPSRCPGGSPGPFPWRRLERFGDGRGSGGSSVSSPLSTRRVFNAFLGASAFWDHRALPSRPAGHALATPSAGGERGAPRRGAEIWECPLLQRQGWPGASRP